MDTVERELKLLPASASLLDDLAEIDHLGPFAARGRRHEQQVNSFFDSSSHALEHARVGFRRRVVDGQRLATWSIKGDAKHLGGIATRSEIELQLDPDTPPALALSTLRDAARSRGAAALAGAVDDALTAGLPLGRPYLETETDRRIVDLSSAETEIELALDRMRIRGHAYTEVEIEAELKRGEESALSAVREAIESLGEVSESKGSKLSRATAHIRECACPTL